MMSYIGPRSLHSGCLASPHSSAGLSDRCPRYSASGCIQLYASDASPDHAQSTLPLRTGHVRGELMHHVHLNNGTHNCHWWNYNYFCCYLHQSKELVGWGLLSVPSQGLAVLWVQRVPRPTGPWATSYGTVQGHYETIPEDWEWRRSSILTSHHHHW